MPNLASCPDVWLDLVREGQKESEATNAGGGSASITEGSRNDTLFRIACSHRGNGADEAALLQALLRENMSRCAPPLPESEVRQLAASAMRYPPNIPATDLDLARLLVAKRGANIRYDHGRKHWYCWNGACWQEDTNGWVLRLLKAITDDLLRDTASIVDDKTRQEARRAVLRMRSKPRLEGALSLAASEPDISIAATDFDKALMLLNAPNCVIELATGAPREHRREDYMTRVCGAVYDPQARCQRFIAFLKSIFGDDEELITYVQTIIGYALTGETSEQCLFLFHGAGANGKSVLLSVFRAILGAYALNASTETFLQKPGGRGASNDIARLNGARFVTAVESDEGRKLDEALIKMVTGGDPITARFLFAEYVEFWAQFKLFFATNHRPHMNGADRALWRRVHLVPFNFVIPEEQRQRKFDQILLEEREGILRWAVEGSVKWFKNGLVVPKCVRLATENYRRELDHVGAFLDEMCEQGPGLEEATANIQAAYTAWAIENDRPHMNSQRLGAELTNRGIQAIKRGGKAFRANARLRARKLKLVEAA